jgi:phospholipid transport system transporter-binding protein
MGELMRGEGKGPAAAVSVAESGPDRYGVRGPLTFATARRALDAGLGALAAARGASIEMDCGEVSASDSAGLAVLIEWLAWARRNGRELHFANVPEAICAVARICEIEGLLLGR